MLVSRQATFEEVIQALVKKQLSIPPEIYDRIRLFDVRQHKEYKELQPTQVLSTTPFDTSYGTNIFAEPIPVEADTMTDMDKFILIVHFTKDIARLHSLPLKFVVKPVPHGKEFTNCVQRELWYDTKKRLQKRLGYKDFSKIKAFFTSEVFHNSKLTPLEDGIFSLF